MSDNDVPLTGRIKEKLVAAKERWAREGRLLTGETAELAAGRLPPGQREVRDWPVLDLGLQPHVATDEWSFGVGGLVENAISWSWADFMAQPQVSLISDIHCVTSWSRYANRWDGVSTAHLLSVVRPRPEARFVVLRSFDGYSTNLPLERFAAADALLAHSWEGKPLTREHGGPVRAVVPQLYFWKSAKWLRHITFLERDAPGYWEVRGYHNEGDPWKEDRYG
jgi:DMSO/TMAO reductase YedYZ molybdopterin-dependent catalytic subunit